MGQNRITSSRPVQYVVIFATAEGDSKNIECFQQWSSGILVLLQAIPGQALVSQLSRRNNFSVLHTNVWKAP